MQCICFFSHLLLLSSTEHTSSSLTQHLFRLVLPLKRKCYIYKTKQNNKKIIWLEDRGTQKLHAKFQLFQDKLWKCYKLSNYSSTNNTTTICRNRLFICHYFSKVPWQTFPSVNKSSERIVKWPAKSFSLLWLMKSNSGTYHYYSVLQPLFFHLCWQTTVVYFCLPHEPFACYSTILFVLCMFIKAMSRLNVGSDSHLGEKLAQIHWHCQKDDKSYELAQHGACSMVPINGTEKSINNASPLTLRDSLIVHFFSLSILFCCSICQYHQNLLLSEMSGE